MIRILQVVNIMDRAGLENMLMNYYRNIDRKEVQFDFLTHRETSGAYDEEILSMGGRVFHAPRLYPQNYYKYFSFMKHFFDDHSEYKIVHSHIDSMSAFPLAAAKRSGIPNRIAHSHSSKLDKDIKLPIKYIALKCIPRIANTYCACGDMAGKFMFGERDFKIIKNAIDIERFRYNEIKRVSTRNKLELNDEIVIGHVGRFCYIKNQIFLLKILKELVNKGANVKLLLVGNGEDKKKIIDEINILNLEQHVIMLIDRDDVEDLYQAMDVFVMPSLFEGLPVVGVEAQASGLPCLFSDKISKEVLIANNSRMISLNASVEEWGRSILSISKKRNYKANEELRNARYDIKSESKKLCSWYLELGE